MNNIMDLYDKLTKKNVPRDYRRKIMFQFYYTIAFAMVGTRIEDISEFTGYSEKSCKNKINGDAYLLKLYNKVKHLDDTRKDSKIRNDMQRIQSGIERPKDAHEIAMMLFKAHLARTEKTLDYRNSTHKEQEEIKTRIKMLYL